MDNRALSELIGLIYDAAFDVDLWPRLLEILADELETLLAADTKEQKVTPASNRIDSIDRPSPLASHTHRSESSSLDANRPEEISSSEFALIDLLRSHFARALELNRQAFVAREERNAMEELLERLPMGMMIVDSESRVLAHNRKLDKILSEGKGISVTNSVLTAKSSMNAARLKQMIRAVANGDEREAQAIKLSRPGRAMPLSALVLPFKAHTSLGGISSSQAVVLVAAPEIHLEIPQATLISLYQLTPAEAKLVSSLVRDRSLNSIAEDFGLSKHTIRTQLKSIYQKTGTRRQAELVRQVITGPAMLATIASKQEMAVHPWLTSKQLPTPAESEARRHQTVCLPDNRLLGYAEYGVRNGFPVILMHAMIGSRLQAHPDETTVERYGVRLIIPDRPGVGLSDSRKDMTLLDWADDVECLADHLGLERFNVVGYSTGCAFGLACTYRLGKRISRLVLASSVAPFTSIKELGGMSAPFQLLLSLGKYAPSLLGPLVRLMSLQRKPDMLYDEMLKQVPPVDHALLSDTTVRERFIEDTRENLRQGDHHILRELLLISRDWGFELTDVKVPVVLWYGESDRIVSLRMVSRLTGALPNCQINYVPGAGHYLLFYRWEEILKAAVSSGC